jgi:hypothetical protein
MTNSILAPTAKFHHFSIYDLLDRNQTLEKAYDRMEAYQHQWLQQHKRGGMVASVYDVLQAILSLMPKTMEEIRQEQPKVFEDAIEQQHFFCFTNNVYLAKMLNKQQARPVLQGKGRTVRRAIQKLLDAKVLLHKVNFIHTGIYNPKPFEQCPDGRGKFKLIFNPALLIWGKTTAEAIAGAPKSDTPRPSDFPITRTSCPQSIILVNTELKEQYTKTHHEMMDKVSTKADDKLLINQGTVQEGKPKSPPKPNLESGKSAQKVFIPTNLENKAEFFAQQLFEQARVALWQGKIFNQQQSQHAVELIGSHFRQIQTDLEQFRAQKIQQFVQSSYYQGLSNNPKHQKRILNNWFSKKLPQVATAALQIMSEAIQKQRENGLKHHYLEHLFAPGQYFSSPYWLKALEYSKKDWNTIQTKYSDKNSSLVYYQLVMEHIHQSQSKIVEALRDGTSPQFARSTTEQAWKKLQLLLQKAPPEVSTAQRTKLQQKFNDRIKPLFHNQI